MDLSYAWKGFVQFAANTAKGEFDLEGSRRGFKELSAAVGVSPTAAAGITDLTAKVVLGDRCAQQLYALTSALVEDQPRPEAPRLTVTEAPRLTVTEAPPR